MTQYNDFKSTPLQTMLLRVVQDSQLKLEGTRKFINSRNQVNINLLRYSKVIL